jgi:hypothetical protein
MNEEASPLAAKFLNVILTPSLRKIIEQLEKKEGIICVKTPDTSITR